LSQRFDDLSDDALRDEPGRIADAPRPAPPSLASKPCARAYRRCGHRVVIECGGFSVEKKAVDRERARRVEPLSSAVAVALAPDRRDEITATAARAGARIDARAELRDQLGSLVPSPERLTQTLAARAAGAGGSGISSCLAFSWR